MPRFLAKAVCALALALALLLGASAARAELQFPALSGRVVDEANILTPATKSALTEMLARHESATGEQVVVVTLKSLQGGTIEDYGYRLGRTWGIGEKTKNTGALLIVAPSERKVRIEVGYGLEGQLTDALSRVIIERDILPAFRRGDYNTGVLAGTVSILQVLGGNPTAAAPANAAAGARTAGAGSFALAQFIFFLVIFILIFGMRMHPAFLLGSAMMMSGRGYRSYGAPGGFSGGFSGGGGSFGGGGASGSW